MALVPQTSASSKGWALAKPGAFGSSPATAGLLRQMQGIRSAQTAVRADVAKVISTKDYEKAVTSRDKSLPVSLRFDLEKVGKGIKSQYDTETRMLVNPSWSESPGWMMGMSIPVPINIEYGYMSKETKAAISAAVPTEAVLNSHAMKREQLVYKLVNEYNAAVEAKWTSAQMKMFPKALTASPFWDTIPKYWKRFLTLGNVNIFEQLFSPPSNNPNLSPCTSRSKQLEGALYDKTVTAAQHDILVMLELCKHLYILTALKKLKTLRIPISTTLPEVKEEDEQAFQKWMDSVTGETGYNPTADVGENCNVMKPVIEELIKAHRIIPKHPQDKPISAEPCGIATGTFVFNAHVIPSGLYETNFSAKTTTFNASYMPKDDKMYGYWMCTDYMLLRPSDPMLAYHQIQSDPVAVLTPDLYATPYNTPVVVAHVPNRHESLLQFSEYANNAIDEYLASKQSSDATHASTAAAAGESSDAMEVDTPTAPATSSAVTGSTPESTAAATDASRATNWDDHPALGMSMTVVEYIPWHPDASSLRMRSPTSATPDTVKRANDRRKYRMGNYDVEIDPSETAPDAATETAKGQVGSAPNASAGGVESRSGSENDQPPAASSAPAATTVTAAPAAGSTVAPAAEDKVLALRYFSVATRLEYGPLTRVWQSPTNGNTYFDLNLNFSQYFLHSAIGYKSVSRFGLAPSDLKWDEFVFPLFKNTLMYFNAKRGSEEQTRKATKMMNQILPVQDRRQALSQITDSVMNLLQYHVPYTVSGRGHPDLPRVVTVQLPLPLTDIQNAMLNDGVPEDAPVETKKALEQGIEIMQLVEKCIHSCTDIMAIGTPDNMDAVIELSQQQTLFDPALTIPRVGYELNFESAKFVESLMTPATHLCGNSPDVPPLPKGMTLVNSLVPTTGTSAPKFVASLDPATAQSAYKFYIVIVGDFIDPKSGEKMFSDMDVAQTAAVFHPEFITQVARPRFICSDYFEKRNLPRGASFAQKCVNLAMPALGTRKFLLYAIQVSDAAKNRAALAKEAFQTDCSLWRGKRLVPKRRAPSAVEIKVDAGGAVSGAATTDAAAASGAPTDAIGPKVEDCEPLPASDASDNKIIDHAVDNKAEPQVTKADAALAEDLKDDDNANDPMRVTYAKRKEPDTKTQDTAADPPAKRTKLGGKDNQKRRDKYLEPSVVDLD